MRQAGIILWVGPILLSGCVHYPERPAVDASSVSPRLNTCGGNCVELKPNAGIDNAAFIRKVDELLSAQRYATLDSLVGRRLDVAIEVLRQHDGKRPATEAHLMLARIVDARLGHPANAGWTAHMQGQSSGNLMRVEDILAKARECSRNQDWKAVRDLIQRNQSVLAPYPFHTIQSGMMLSEAQRRIGQVEPAAQSWRETVTGASRLISNWPAPALWEQMAAQRPVSVAWPAPVISAFAKKLPDPLKDLPKDPKFAAEAIVWFHIGTARLERSEAALALSAFKHADSHSAYPVWDDLLALYQAKALLALQQAPAATSLLTVLTSRPLDCPWRLPALALLGSGKLQEGHTKQAHAFLKEAVETTQADFVFRADAEANFGLTLLAEGDQANGLRWVHAARTRFGATQDRSGLMQCLENEAAYLAHTGKIDEANQVRQMLREQEASQVR